MIFASWPNRTEKGAAGAKAAIASAAKPRVALLIVMFIVSSLRHFGGEWTSLPLSAPDVKSFDQEWVLGPNLGTEWEQTAAVGASKLRPLMILSAALFAATCAPLRETALLDYLARPSATSSRVVSQEGGRTRMELQSGEEYGRMWRHVL
ncbi:MAG: hypothetical protein C4320_07775, partial [Armatimonadota bacterium]